MSETPTVRPIPYTDPVRAFAPFADAPVAALLDSAAMAGGRGRYAYVAADPFRVVTAAGAGGAAPGTAVDGAPVDGDPFAVLGAELGRVRIARDQRLPPFQGGAVGYLGYELGRHIEVLPPSPVAGLDVPDMVMGFYDTVAAFDTERREAWVIAHDVAAGAGAGRPPAGVRAEAMAARIAEAPPAMDVDWGMSGAWTAEVAREQYESMVARAIDYIHAGDIFQANLTQRLLGAMPAGFEPITLYRRLRALSPAPFAAYLAAGEGTAVLSASPERFLRLDGAGRVSTRPIKGTRPRGRTPDEDARLARDLVASQKDRAENLMIVDLLRNDLSRVCRLGSVEVGELAVLESFANVHHLVSEVRGTLFPNLSAVDLLRATFPGGSITGAPKIRAMEIINELEPARRGPYCGAIAWIGFDGAMDSSIVIRTLTVKGNAVAAQAGGGIVADSDPAAEYEETMDKVWPLLQSLDPGDIREERSS